MSKKFQNIKLDRQPYSVPIVNVQNTSNNWCQNCNSKRFQNYFDKWTSGNICIDKFIQEAQLKARNEFEL